MSLYTKPQVNVNFLTQSLIKTKSQSKNIWPRKQKNLKEKKKYSLFNTEEQMVEFELENWC